MERALSDYEKIKKAEAIYNRRKMMGVGGVRLSSPTDNEKVAKRELSNVKKMVIQICVCIAIYFIVYLIQNSNYIFSEDFIGKTKELLEYDTNFSTYISQFIDSVKKNIEKITNGNVENGVEDGKNGALEQNAEKNNAEEDNGEENSGKDSTETNRDEKENAPTGENTQTMENNDADNQNEAGGVGGGEPEYIEENNFGAIENAQEEKSQMELDAETVKNNYSLDVPLKGEITSPYGERSISPKFHLGVDIGENTGANIVSAMDGEVTLVSKTGDYGYHIKISSGDLVTLYAHCSKLDVYEGQQIKKGDKIAEVGETGNATGPHLHFEIIYQR